MNLFVLKGYNPKVVFLRSAWFYHDASHTFSISLNHPPITIFTPANTNIKFSTKFGRSRKLKVQGYFFETWKHINIHKQIHQRFVFFLVMHILELKDILVIFFPFKPLKSLPWENLTCIIISMLIFQFKHKFPIQSLMAIQINTFSEQ